MYGCNRYPYTRKSAWYWNLHSVEIEGNREVGKSGRELAWLVSGERVHKDGRRPFHLGIHCLQLYPCHSRSRWRAPTSRIATQSTGLWKIICTVRSHPHRWKAWIKIYYMYLWFSHTPYDPYDGRQDTIAVPSKLMDGLCTVCGQDGWCPSTTHMLYGRNRIRLRWTALPATFMARLAKFYILLPKLLPGWAVRPTT